MLTITEAEKKNIYTCLKELNICNRCILRYLGYTIHDHGKKVFLNSENILSTAFEIEDKDCSSETKRLKINPCRACLSVLDDTTIENYTAVINDDFKVYEMQDFYTTLNFPISMFVREYGMFVFLKEKFPDIYKDFNVLEKVKRVFRLISSNLFSEKLLRNFQKESNFQINVNIIYADEGKETENLQKISKLRKISKNNVENSLSSLCSVEEYKKHFPLPPSIQDKETSATVTFSSSSVFLGGRYLKFSRDMGQTPFIVNNSHITEFSVQDVMFDSIVKILKCDKEKLTFSASGREDADTRMLGDGRPFYIQINEPKFEKITSEQCEDIETIIAQSNTVVVIKLQQVSQTSTKHIKFGEQNKRKHYRAICKTLAPSIEDVISKIINLGSSPLVIKQSTPIRVLHRRSHLVRDKKIFEIKSAPVQNYSDMFCLDVITEAGTYVKEFVNGDFHRTTPNLCEITGYPVDVVALDVTAVELEWPLEK